MNFITKLILITLTLCSYVLSDKNLTMDLTIGNYTVPANFTTVYLCKMFKIHEKLEQGATPNDAKAQLIGLEALIDNRNVHHIAIRGCISKAKFNTEIVRCEKEMPADCPYMLGVTTVGKEKNILPKNVGLDWGVGNTKIVMIIIHYHNPEKKSFKDNSGLRIFYTNKLRKYRMGIVITGKDVYDPEMYLPPGNKNITITDMCYANCTNRLPPEGIKIFGALLHGHQVLKRIRLEIKFKNGTIDNRTFRDDSFSFNNQYFKYLPDDKPIELKPGDTIKTICEFDTSKKNITVRGGLGSDDEMCLIFIYYYPYESGFAFCKQNRCVLPEDLEKFSELMTNVTIQNSTRNWGFLNNTVNP
jgi:dopamine beta-monooxygenase